MPRSIGVELVAGRAGCGPWAFRPSRLKSEKGLSNLLGMSELISLPPDLRPGLMPDQMVQSVVTEAFRVLLNTKHLYQHVDISVDAVSKQLRPTLRKLYPLEQHSDYQLSKTLHPLFGYWYPRAVWPKRSSVAARNYDFRLTDG